VLILLLHSNMKAEFIERVIDAVVSFYVDLISEQKE
jgi:hypothetical protein